MRDVFINYRTNDEENVAGAIDRELSRRFGSDRIFFASKTIPPGDDFRSWLLAGARGSRVLLAIIGSRWLTATGTRSRTGLADEADWTRLEIAEAFAHGGVVVPVLVGRTNLPNEADLPKPLAGLASCQRLRFDYQNVAGSYDAICGALEKRIPGLHDRDQDRDDDPRRDGGIGSVGENSGTIFNGPTGPVHTGSGAQHNAPYFAGDGVNYTAGDHDGDIRQRFDRSAERRDDGDSDA